MKLNVKAMLFFVVGVAAANIALGFADRASSGKLTQIGARG